VRRLGIAATLAFLAPIGPVNVRTDTVLIPAAAGPVRQGLGDPPHGTGAQSLNGSNSPSPAIATANGRSVCSTRMVPACSASTSGSRR